MDQGILSYNLTNLKGKQMYNTVLFKYSQCMVNYCRIELFQ